MRVADATPSRDWFLLAVSSLFNSKDWRITEWQNKVAHIRRVGNLFFQEQVAEEVGVSEGLAAE